jgi:hypothetical protein
MEDVPNWIHAIAAVPLVIVTTWTLVVLRKYAADTKSMAKNSSEQIENAQMPFVALVMGSSPSRPWIIKNQGFGPALNIVHTEFDGTKNTMRWTTPLAPGEESVISLASGGLIHTIGFTVEYESLGGKQFRTITKQTSGQLQTTFQKLP